MPGTVTASLTLTSDKTTKVSKSYYYKDAFQIQQELEGNTNSLTTLLNVDASQKGASNIQGFKTMMIHNPTDIGAEIIIERRETTNGSSPDVMTTTPRYESLLLMPNEFIFIPNPRSINVASNTSGARDGVQNNLELTVTEDSGKNLSSSTLSDTAVSITLESGVNAPLFKIGDYIQIDTEVMEVTSASGNVLGVVRGQLGSTAAGHGGGSSVLYARYNQFHNFDDTSINGGGNGSAMKIKTNKGGNYKGSAIGGTYTRTIDGRVDGIVPSSFAVQFYSPGFQSFNLAGATSSTSTRIAAGSTVTTKVTVDGGTPTEVSITTDSSDQTLNGSRNALIPKFNAAFDNAGLECTMGIIDGDVRITSKNHLSTSSIAISAPSGNNILGQGIFPSTPKDAEVAKFADRTTTDKETGIVSPNKSVYLYDDGYGNLKSSFGASGTIEYDTGHIEIVGGPQNAEMVFTFSYQSAHAGSLFNGGTFSSSSNPSNHIVQISGRSLSNILNTYVVIQGYR